MSHQYGFVVAEEDEKASDPLTSTSRIDTRRLLSPLKAGEYINSYENTDKSNNKELNNKGKQGVNKKNSLANKKNYQHQNSKYKYFSLLREPFLENEDIINMSDSTREVYNTNKRYDKLTRLKNQLKMNKLRKMIDAKTFVEPDFSDNKPSILFVRKKDMRSNVYNPCLSYKPGYETLIKKSVRPVGFKKTKSQTLSENIIQMNDLKSNYIKSNSNINANNLNETNENTTDEGAEIELNKNNYDKSSIVSKMNINTQNEENKCQTNTCSLIKEKNKINHKNLNSFKIDNEYIIQEEKKFKNSPVKNINLSKILITQQQNIKTNTFHNAKRSLNKEDQENAMMKKLRDKFLEEKKKNFKKEADINLKTTKSINNINSNYNKLQKKCKKKSKSLNINNSISNNSLFERLSQSNSFNNFSDSEYTKQYNIDNKYNSKNFNSDTKNKTSQKLDILRKNKIDIINKRDITSTQSNLRPNSTNLVYDKKFFLSFKEKNKIKENLFREKLTKFRKIFGLAYKESKRLDNRDKVTDVEITNKNLEKTIKERNVLVNINKEYEDEKDNDDYILKKYFDKNDLFNSSSDNELNEDFIDRHKETLKTCKDDKVRAHLIAAFTKIEVEDRILHRNKYKYNLEEKFRSFDEKKEYKKLANKKMALEKELTKNIFDINDYLENRHLVNEIINMDQSNPMDVLKWNVKKSKIMRDIKPNIILQFNKKKKNMIKKQND